MFELKEHVVHRQMFSDGAVPEPALPLEWCSEAWPRLPFHSAHGGGNTQGGTTFCPRVILIPQPSRDARVAHSSTHH